MVEERSVAREGAARASAGGDGSEAAGMSNEKTGESPVRRNSQGSLGKASPPRVSRDLSRGQAA